MEKLDILKDILDSSFQYEFLEDENTGYKILKLTQYYGEKTIYINFYNLINLLANYSALDKVLIKDLKEVE